MKTILVTGGAGFIGSHLIDALLRGGWEKVICIDNFDDNYDPALKEENVRPYAEDTRFVLYRADIRDQEKMKEIFAAHNPQAVVHLAAKADTRKAVEAPAEYIQVNVDGTLTIFECARHAGVKKIVFISSSSVYGNKNRAPFEESAQTDFPISPYGASKKAGEVLAYSYYYNFAMPITCLRIFNAYGERMRPGLVLYKWVDDILHDRKIEMSGEGVRMRDFTYVGDIVQAILLSLDTDLGYEIINIGSSDPIALKDLLVIVEKATGKKADTFSRPSTKPSVEMTHASTQKAEKLLGWKPETTIEQGIARLVMWFVSERLK